MANQNNQNNQITYDEFTSRIQAATVRVYDSDIEYGAANVCVTIKHEDIEFSVQVWVGHEWNQGRFYETQETYCQQCPTVVDEHGETVIEGVVKSYRSEDYSGSDVRELVREKIEEVITVWWSENEQALIESHDEMAANVVVIGG